jgi:hypothetical protein
LAGLEHVCQHTVDAQSVHQRNDPGVGGHCVNDRASGIACSKSLRQHDDHIHGVQLIRGERHAGVSRERLAPGHLEHEAVTVDHFEMLPPDVNERYFVSGEREAPPEHRSHCARSEDAKAHHAP